MEEERQRMRDRSGQLREIDREITKTGTGMRERERERNNSLKINDDRKDNAQKKVSTLDRAEI